MYRKTYANIYVDNIKDNVKTIKNKYNGYRYYIGVVKADCYGHNGYKVIDSIIAGGCNYLAVSSLEEALKIRKKFNIPILCLGIIDIRYMKTCEKNNIDVTVTNLQYLKKIKNYNLNIHIKIDTGMNRIGLKSREEFEQIILELKNSNLYLKGIFTHMCNTKSKEFTDMQLNIFKYVVRSIDLNSIEMVHISQSDTLINYPKIDFCNACRLGIIMYGLTKNNLNLKDTISLCSEVIEIKQLNNEEFVGYNCLYKAKKGDLLAIVPIGYADGINRHLKDSYIYINSKKYKIIGNICMDMLMVLVDNTVKLKDKVYIYKDINHIFELSKKLNTIPYELICSISKRVPRKYIINKK